MLWFGFFEGQGGGKGEKQLCSVPLVQGNPEGVFAQTGGTREEGGSVYTRESKAF